MYRLDEAQVLDANSTFTGMFPGPIPYLNKSLLRPFVEALLKFDSRLVMCGTGFSSVRFLITWPSSKAMVKCWLVYEWEEEFSPPKDIYQRFQTQQEGDVEWLQKELKQATNTVCFVGDKDLVIVLSWSDSRLVLFVQWNIGDYHSNRRERHGQEMDALLKDLPVMQHDLSPLSAIKNSKDIQGKRLVEACNWQEQSSFDSQFKKGFDLMTRFRSAAT
jgi:hypothetical protein